MCEGESLFLSLSIFLLILIIFLILYLLTIKVCLTYNSGPSWLKLFPKQLISSTYSFNNQELRDTPLSWTVKITELGIYFVEEPHRLRNWISLSLVLELQFFLWISARSPSRWTLLLRFNRVGSQFLKFLQFARNQKFVLPWRKPLDTNNVKALYKVCG